jgi:hypothetical protein
MLVGSGDILPREGDDLTTINKDQFFILKLVLMYDTTCRHD